MSFSWRLLAALTVVSCLPVRHAPAESGTLTGFRKAASDEQLKREERFASELDTKNLREWMKRMTTRPHHVGSPFGKEVAEFIAEKFRSWGYETEVPVYHVLFPTPKERRLELLEPTPFVASLVEPGVAGDPTSEVGARDGLPPYNAYSADGDVSAALVYVNYGVPADYDELTRRGIDVRGRIVIARYGGAWRGVKPKVAAEKGAIGCILYSDPVDDGYFRGDDYPAGPYKNDRGVQRGSVVDLPVRPGDPLTPGIGATENAKRLSREESETLMQIPVLPISYSDALPLLRALGGPVAPESWRGALPLTYHLGPGPAKVRLKLTFDWSLVPAYNVIARLPGRESPEQWVIRGNHHDAWVLGADDPISGVVALMEEARSVAELVKGGWRPRRSIVYCAWDAEEPGLLGSIEWVEQHAADLRERVVAYINTDSNGRGFMRVGGSHSLEKLVNAVAADVIDPQTNVSVLERYRSRGLVNGNTEERAKLLSETTVPIKALGSGSDYTPFLDHLGVSALHMAYGGEDFGGEYHTLYDTFEAYTRFGDPEFRYGIALAELCGRAVLRLVESEVVPFEFVGAARTYSMYVDEVIALADAMREETELHNRLVRERRFEIAADPTKPFVAPKEKAPVPHLNFAPLLNARERLTTSAGEYASARKDYFASKRALSANVLDELNRTIYQAERVLTRQEGLPRRPWFRHYLYAPGLYTGYGVKTMPGVREAIEERSWEEAQEHIVIAAAVLDRYCAEIARASNLLSSNRP